MRLQTKNKIAAFFLAGCFIASVSWPFILAYVVIHFVIKLW